MCLAAGCCDQPQYGRTWRDHSAGLHQTLSHYRGIGCPQGALIELELGRLTLRCGGVFCGGERLGGIARVVIILLGCRAVLHQLANPFRARLSLCALCYHPVIGGHRGLQAGLTPVSPELS